MLVAQNAPINITQIKYELVSFSSLKPEVPYPLLMEDLSKLNGLMENPEEQYGLWGGQKTDLTDVYVNDKNGQQNEMQ